MKTARFKLLVVCGTMLGLSTLGCKEHLPKNTMAPAFRLLNLKGQNTALSQYQGQVVLLAFWAVG